MQAKILDEQLSQKVHEDAYKDALVKSTSDLLGESMGNLAHHMARARVFESRAALLQQHLQQHMEQPDGNPASASGNPAGPRQESIHKLQRQLEAETRMRQAVETHLREERKKSKDLAAEILDLDLKSCKALASIRDILGDPEGKLMQEELVEKVRELAQIHRKKPRKTKAAKSPKAENKPSDGF